MIQNGRNPRTQAYLKSKLTKAGSHIMVNVVVMDATNTIIAWSGRDQEGGLLSVAHPEKTPLERAPVVAVSTMKGSTTLVAATRQTKPAAGRTTRLLTIPRSSGCRRIQRQLLRGKSGAGTDGMSDPNAFNELYNQERVRRGLQPPLNSKLFLTLRRHGNTPKWRLCHVCWFRSAPTLSIDVL